MPARSHKSERERALKRLGFGSSDIESIAAKRVFEVKVQEFLQSHAPFRLTTNAEEIRFFGACRAFVEREDVGPEIFGEDSCRVGSTLQYPRHANRIAFLIYGLLLPSVKGDVSDAMPSQTGSLHSDGTSSSEKGEDQARSFTTPHDASDSIESEDGDTDHTEVASEHDDDEKTEHEVPGKTPNSADNGSAGITVSRVVIRDRDAETHDEWHPTIPLASIRYQDVMSFITTPPDDLECLSIALSTKTSHLGGEGVFFDTNSSFNPNHWPVDLGFQRAVEKLAGLACRKSDADRPGYKLGNRMYLVVIACEKRDEI